jgi:hypothetical protein
LWPALVEHQNYSPVASFAMSGHFLGNVTGFFGFFKIDLNTIFSCNAFNFFLFLEFYASTFPGISLILRVKTTEIQRFDLNIL